MDAFVNNIEQFASRLAWWASYRAIVFWCFPIRWPGVLLQGLTQLGDSFDLLYRLCRQYTVGCSGRATVLLFYDGHHLVDQTIDTRPLRSFMNTKPTVIEGLAIFRQENNFSDFRWNGGRRRYKYIATFFDSHFFRLASRFWPTDPC